MSNQHSEDFPLGSHPDFPESFRWMFWDCDFEKLRWKRYRYFIVGRIMEWGRPHEWDWLRAKTGDKRLVKWWMKNKGRGMSWETVKRWQTILRLPKADVKQWLSDPVRKHWDCRVQSRIEEKDKEID